MLPEAWERGQTASIYEVLFVKIVFNVYFYVIKHNFRNKFIQEMMLFPHFIYKLYNSKLCLYDKHIL